MVIKDAEVGIAYSPDIILRFGIEGGAEIPHFYLTLRLRHPGANNENDRSNDLEFKAVWTAWGEKGYDTDRLVTTPGRLPPMGDLYTFSSRIQSVPVSLFALGVRDAAHCGGSAGRKEP